MSKQGEGAKHSMTKDDSSRIQSSQAKHGNDTGKDTFASRTQSAGDKWANGNAGNAGSGQGSQK
ncbi:hypothetical protein K474DRAFT_1669783 [Panus rudis PR-1116 ss-1]|nr:hypothetical protein K474DRAFT_1669783 [Panus rudis PR-1116 ss-1]